MANTYTTVADLLLNRKKRVRTASYRGTLLRTATRVTSGTSENHWMRQPKNSYLYVSKIPYTACIDSLYIETDAAMTAAFKFKIVLLGIQRDGGFEELCDYGTEHTPGAVSSDVITDYSKIDMTVAEIVKAAGQEAKLNDYMKGKNGKDANYCVLAFKVTTTAGGGTVRTTYINLRTVEGCPSEMPLNTLSPDTKPAA